MRPAGVLVGSPLFNDATRGGEPSEEVLVEALVAEAAVQALDEAVLRRLSRRNVVPFDAPIFLPLQDRARGQLGAVVGDDHQRSAARLDEGIELPRHSLAGERRVDDERQAFPREVVALRPPSAPSTTTSARKRRPSTS